MPKVDANAKGDRKMFRFDNFSSIKAELNKKNGLKFMLIIALFGITPWLLLVFIRGLFPSINTFSDNQALKTGIVYSSLFVVIELLYCFYNFIVNKKIHHNIKILQSAKCLYDFGKCLDDFSVKANKKNIATDQAKRLIDASYHMLITRIGDIEYLNDRISTSVPGAKLYIEAEYKEGATITYLKLGYPSSTKIFSIALYS